jgi:hypothetical protein
VTDHSDADGAPRSEPGNPRPSCGLGDLGCCARSWAALCADLADCTDELLHRIRQVADSEPTMWQTPATEGASPLDELAAGVDRYGQRIKLIGAVNAAQALAWEHLHEAGGPDNPQAYAEFTAAFEFHLALIADPLPDHDTDTGSC